MSNTRNANTGRLGCLGRGLVLGLCLLGSVGQALAAQFAYVANRHSNTISVYTINPVTGALTAGTTVATGGQPYSVTVHPSRKFAYMANSTSHNISAYTSTRSPGR